MSQTVDEICVDPRRSCFWRCQTGQLSLFEQPRVLASFLDDLQRSCTNRGYTVERESIHDIMPV